MGVDDRIWWSENSAEATIQQSKAAAVVKSNGMLAATTTSGGENRMTSGASRDQVDVPMPSAQERGSIGGGIGRRASPRRAPIRRIGQARVMRGGRSGPSVTKVTTANETKAGTACSAVWGTRTTGVGGGAAELQQAAQALQLPFKPVPWCE
jgi:hypothetical protein